MDREISLFGTDIDVRVPKGIVKDVSELADAYGLSYLVHQSTCDTFSICVQFQEYKAEQIASFISDVNLIKSSLN